MNTHDDLPLPGQLFAAATTATDHLVKFNLQLARDQVWEAIKAFERQPTPARLRELVGVHTHATRLLSLQPDPKPPGSGGALTEPAQLAA